MHQQVPTYARRTATDSADRETAGPGATPLDPVPLPLSVRDAFPGTARGVWLNTAYQGLLPAAAIEAGHIALARKAWPADLVAEDFDASPQRARVALAGLLGGAAADYALGPSTSYGLHIVANGFPFEAGDEVLLFSDDFPATYLPWTGLNAVTLRVVPRHVLFDPSALGGALGSRTRVACFAWVSSFTGDVIPLEAAGALLRDAGVTVVVNAAQGAGALALDLGTASVDAVASCGWKWLCGPYATAFLWTRPELRQLLVPNHRYWRALGKRLDRADAAGLPEPLPDTWPLDAFASSAFTTLEPWIRSLELLRDIGLQRIRAHDAFLLDMLRRDLPEGYAVVSPSDSPVVVIDPGEGGTERLGALLEAHGIHVAVRAGRIRIAPHIHNTADDIIAALRALSEAAEPSRRLADASG